MFNLNKFYYFSDMLVFDNFFYEVGQGKMFDVEMMLENLFFGLLEGLVMMIDGIINIF